MNNQEQLPSFYTVTPAFVRYNKDLTDFDKLMYGEIAALTNANNYCWASNKYFCKVFGKADKTIRRSIQRLLSANVITSTIQPENGNKRILRLNTPTVKNDRTPTVKNDRTSRARQSTRNNTTRVNTPQPPISLDWFRDYLEDKDEKPKTTKTEKP